MKRWLFYFIRIILCIIFFTLPIFCILKFPTNARELKCNKIHATHITIYISILERVHYDILTVWKNFCSNFIKVKERNLFLWFTNNPSFHFYRREIIIDLLVRALKSLDSSSPRGRPILLLATDIKRFLLVILARNSRKVDEPLPAEQYPRPRRLRSCVLRAPRADPVRVPTFIDGVNRAENPLPRISKLIYIYSAVWFWNSPPLFMYLCATLRVFLAYLNISDRGLRQILMNLFMEEKRLETLIEY